MVSGSIVPCTVGFNPWRGTHCIGGWVDPTASLKVVVKRKVCASGGNRTPSCPASCVAMQAPVTRMN